ncbi:helix-turn-helix domain-containing protein [Bradyrhizobium sp. DASA03068]|uniref:helix-turn-helix domain-containing protein n=1 Tax=Bradyrhizobium sp. BLXBL-01 TaxID=3395915 RepID=UPI003F72592E
MASRELRSGRPIKALADKLGYESAAAFSAMFKKYMGQPPGRDLSTVRFSAKIGE